MTSAVQECGAQLILREHVANDPGMRTRAIRHLEYALDEYLSTHANYWGPYRLEEDWGHNTPGWSRWHCPVPGCHSWLKNPNTEHDEAHRSFRKLARLDEPTSGFVQGRCGHKDFQYENHTRFIQTGPTHRYLGIHAICEYVQEEQE